jgi:hypothetical protein
MGASADLEQGEREEAGAGRRWPIVRLVILLAVGNVLLGVAVFALRSPWATAPEVAAPPALPPQVERLRARIAERHPGEPYSLDLSDEELTATVGYFMARAPDVPFTRVRVTVTGQRVIAEGVTRGLAVTVPVRVSGTLSARDGLPQAWIEDVSLGDTPLPAFVRDQILREANRSLDFSRYRMPLTVDAIELRPGGVTIRGARK